MTLAGAWFCFIVSYHETIVQSILSKLLQVREPLPTPVLCDLQAGLPGICCLEALLLNAVDLESAETALALQLKLVLSCHHDCLKRPLIAYS